MMMIFRILLFAMLFIPSSWLEIGKKNAAIKAAAKSYAETDYEASVANHLRLSSEFGINTPNSSYNLALSYHYNGQLEEAQRTYQSLQSSTDKFITSYSANQNGILLAGQNKYEEALSAFKFSLIKDPTNEAARYNFELLSRWLEENPEQQQQDDQGENKEEQEDQQDQEKDQEQEKDSSDKKDGEGDEKTEEDEATESEKKDDKSGEKSQQEKESDEPSDLESDLSEREKAMEKLKEKLQEMNLTPEQAAQILESMNAAELRYIQQNRKNPSKKPNRGLPEW
ncbi:hypothetical protein [Shivajiella indica]|uniref:Tetratricopeptide repeat protein n=1 Tax=Shivajiella indica TaxID=872115 RepID=A0ABW5B4A6_9BACT